MAIDGILPLPGQNTSLYDTPTSQLIRLKLALFLKASQQSMPTSDEAIKTTYRAREAAVWPSEGCMCLLLVSGKRLLKKVLLARRTKQ